AKWHNRRQGFVHPRTTGRTMPPRSVTVAIVVFWLAVAGWAGWRTAEPYFHAGEPPPFVIDLLDESGQHTVFWRVFQNGAESGDAETEVRQDDNGLFRLSCHYKIDLAKKLAKADVVTRYHVTPKGVLIEISSE